MDYPENNFRTSSFNFEFMWPTLIFFGIGLVYYYYKFNRLRSHIQENPNVLLNRNQGVDRNHQQQENLSHESPNAIKLNFLLQNNRTSLYVDKTVFIKDFIRNTLIPHLNDNLLNNQNISLFVQGRRLDEEKRFDEYSMIGQDTSVHIFFTSNSNTNSRQQNQNDIPSGNRRNEQVGLNDIQAVHIYTLITHLIVLILFMGVVVLTKSMKGILEGPPFFILLIIFVIWSMQFSKCIAKIVIYKKIIYN
jgi:hypothetical protein